MRSNLIILVMDIFMRLSWSSVGSRVKDWVVVQLEARSRVVDK